MYCTKCGGFIEEGGRFCPFCGTKAETEEAAPAEQAAPAEPVTPMDAPPAEPAAPDVTDPGNIPPFTNPIPPERISTGNLAGGAPLNNFGGVNIPTGELRGGQGMPPPAAPVGERKKKSPKNRKKTAVIAAIVTVLVIGVGVGGFFFVKNLADEHAAQEALEEQQRIDREYSMKMERGLRYLQEGRYDEAVVEFQAAIEIAPRKGDAYLNLASAYVELGDTDKAMKCLGEGADQSEDERVLAYRTAMEDAEGTGTLHGNISGYVEGGGVAALAGARVRLYVTDGGELRLARVAETDGDGEFLLEELASADYTIRIGIDGYMGVETQKRIEDGQELFTEDFVLLPELTDEDGEPLPASPYTGRVINAINGQPVEGAQVRFRKDWNNQTGDYAMEDTLQTDENGTFTVTDGLDCGYYTAEITLNSFHTGYMNLVVLPEGYSGEAMPDMTISPVLAEGETRIVLTWGEDPRDVDSHALIDVGGTFYTVYYGNRNYYSDDNVHMVNLDVDDTSSFGPETITVYKGMDKSVTYMVHRYAGSGSLASSGATVRVIQEEGLVATYYVPTDLEGDYWTVFSLDPDGTIHTINKAGWPEQ